MPSTRGSTGAGSRTTRWCPARIDDVEEATNRNRTSVPKEHLVLYQFSARGHDMAQCILGVADRPRARRRQRVLSVAAPAALARPHASRTASPARSAASGGFSDGRDIGVVCNLPKRRRSDRAADVRRRRLAVHAGGGLGAGDHLPSRRPQAIAPGAAPWRSCSAARRRSRPTASGRALTMATTLKLPDAVLHRGQRPRHLGARRHADAGRQHRRESGVVREPVRARWRRHRSAAGCAAWSTKCVAHVRDGNGPALRATDGPAPVEPLRARTTRRAIAPTPRSRGLGTRSAAAAQVVPRSRHRSRNREWGVLEGEVARDVRTGLAAARARAQSRPVAASASTSTPNAMTKRAEPSAGCAAERAQATRRRRRRQRESGEQLRFAEAVRRTLATSSR